MDADGDQNIGGSISLDQGYRTLGNGAVMMGSTHELIQRTMSDIAKSLLSEYFMSLDVAIQNKTKKLPRRIEDIDPELLMRAVDANRHSCDNG